MPSIPPRFILAALALCVSALGAHAASYDFLAAPETDLNRVYRLDRATGEISVCQYGLNPGKTDIGPGFFGVTVCYPPGEGAGPQGSSEYSLVASHHEREGGVFRVDLRSGAMSICYVYTSSAGGEGQVVCTPPGR